MPSKKEILEQVKNLISNQFESAEAAMEFFDKNNNGLIEKNELKELLKQSGTGRMWRGLVAGKMLGGLDKDSDKKLNKEEFMKGISALMNEVSEED